MGATFAFLPGVEEENVIQAGVGSMTELPDYAITDPQDVGRVLNELDKRPFYAIDVETTSLDYKRGQLHGVSLAVEDQQWYVFDKAVVPLVNGLVDMHYYNPKKGVVGHNLKFDLHFLSRFGFRPRFIADTMVAQSLVDENLDAGLKDLAYTRLGIPDLPDFEDLLKDAAKGWYRCSTNGCPNDDIYRTPRTCLSCGKPMKPFTRKLDEVNIMDVPLPTLVEYSAKDTRLTFDLWQVLSNDLKREGMWAFFFNKSMPFLYVLLDMESNGMYINQDKVAALRDEIIEALDRAKETFDKLSGGVNPNSSQQLAHLLFSKLGLPEQYRTRSGQPSTDALVLQRLESLDTTGTVKALQEIKVYEKLLSTYIENFQTRVWKDGRIYTNFNQTGAVTGRLSSSGDINLQNIPARSDLGHRIREAFTAQDGDSVIVCCDYSQLELRLAAHFSGEPALIKAFQENLDPHQMTADMMGVSRAVAKSINFGSVYGVGPRTLCDTIEKSGKPRPKESDAKEWLRKYDETYPTLKKWKWDQVNYAREYGYVCTLLGRKRRLPDINSWDKYLRSRAERQSFNAPIQGSAADVAMQAMLDIHPYLDWFGAKMLAQVHDELVFEVPKDSVEEFSKIVEEKMTGVGKTYNLRVDLDASPGCGESWAAAKE